MKRSTKKGLGLFGKKSRTKRHDERIDFDEQYDQYEDDYEDYDPEYDDDYDDREYEDDDYDRDDDREYEDDYDDYDRRDDRDYEDEDYDDVERDDYEDDDYDKEEDRYEDEEEEDRYEDEPEDDDRYEDDVDDREYNGIPDDEYDREYEDEYYEEDEDYDREDDHYDEDDYDRDDRGYEDDDRYDDEYDRDYRDDRYDDEYDRDYDDRYEDDYDRDDRYDDDEDDYAPVRGRRDRDRGERDRRDRGSRRDRSRGHRESGAAIFFAGAFEKIKNTSAVERIAAAVFLFLIAGAVATGIFYKAASTKNEQISSFADVGTTLGEVEVVGESGLLAMADAEKAKSMTAQMIEEEEEEEEIADDAKGVTVQMTLTSIKSDIKIKFINSETKKLVGNVHFEVSVKCPDGSTITYDDHDKDGIIYKKDIKAGKYTVTPMALSDEYSTYTLDSSSKTITVKDTVEMKAVDVSNEVKKESQVNAAKEDTQVKTEVESQLKDTVEWVESTKTPIGEASDGQYSYDEIKKEDITPPGTTAKLTAGSFMRMAGARTPNEGGSTTSTDNGDASTSKNSTESSGGGNGTGGSGTDGGNTDNPGEGGGSTTPKEKTQIVASVDKSDLKVGETATISITTGPSSVTCTSNDNSVATVDGKTITAKGKGSAKIKISGGDDYKDAEVTVNVSEVPNKDMTVSADKTSIKVGETANITVTGPSSPKLEIVEGAGNAELSNKVVKGKAKGTVKIKVTADSEHYNPAEITITVQDADKKNFETSAKEITVKEKESVDIASALSLKNAPSDIKYTSSDAGIAKVEDNKKVTGVTPGKSTTITLTANGYNDYPVTVKVVGKDTVPVSFNKATVVEGQSLKITAKDNVKIKNVVPSVANIVTVNGDTITGKAAGDVTLTVSADGYTDAKIEVKVVGKGTVLKDKSGNTVYVKDGDKYREATYQDYYDGNKKFYTRKAATAFKYTGWQTLDGKTYFYDKNGDRVKGEQVIQGAKYTFDSDGALVKSPGAMGIDVSKWNGNIDWNAVKNSGVNFVIIRCGYRGSSEGTLIEDPKFRANIKGAQAAGLRVGVYFFTQAVNEVEAVEEASMVISLCKGYSLSFPVYLDVEGSNGRGDRISAEQRTANIKAFCGTIKNAGYQVGVYANKTWFTSKINTSQITGYKIWLAQYASQVTYTGSRYDMWQYTSKGKVTGISGNVDMNICY